MRVRPFGWRDLPGLLRNRRNSVFLNSYLLLTRGAQQIPGALLSSVAPSMGVFTCVGRGEPKQSGSIIAQIVHRTATEFSYLTFITPQDGLESPALNGVLEYLVKVSGDRGAFHMVADVDESHRAHEALRGGGFATYTRQRVWRLADAMVGNVIPDGWRPATDLHTVAIRSLFHNQVPKMVQQVEPEFTPNLKGLVYYRDGELLAFVELRSGHRGIWMQPFFHPDIPDVVERLKELSMHVLYRKSRPGYICVRSYQAWLEPALEAIGAQPGATHAVLVKHLAASQKAELSFEMPVIEGTQPEVTAPILRNGT
jgi:hypothetical protein